MLTEVWMGTSLAQCSTDAVMGNFHGQGKLKFRMKPSGKKFFIDHALSVYPVPGNSGDALYAPTPNTTQSPRGRPKRVCTAE